MRISIFAAALPALACAAPAGAEPLFSQAGPGSTPSLTLPGLPPIPLPPGALVFGPNGPVVPNPGLRPSLPHGPPAEPALDAKAPPHADPPPKPPSRKEALDALFARLAKATDPDESKGIAAAIERLWMRSGSDTADLLMNRAEAALGEARRDVALSLLDKVVALRPDWAEAWNRRATVRFLDDDDAGSMEDISHVLVLEPRHFGALSGMAIILKRNGLAKQALTTLKRAAEIYPGDEGIRKLIEEVTPDALGRDL